VQRYHIFETTLSIYIYIYIVDKDDAQETKKSSPAKKRAYYGGGDKLKHETKLFNDATCKKKKIALLAYRVVEEGAKIVGLV
jgi:hypothetical protein